jgi:hypothetical protein
MCCALNGVVAEIGRDEFGVMAAEGLLILP